MTRWQSKTPMTWTKLHPFFSLSFTCSALFHTLPSCPSLLQGDTLTHTGKSVSQKCRGSFFSTLPISPLSIAKPSLLSSPTPSLTPLSLLSNSIITASLFPSSSLLPLLLLPFLSETFPSAHSTPPKPKAKKKKKKMQRNQEMRKGRRRRLIVVRVVVLKIQSIQAVNFSLKSLTGGGSSLSSSRCSLLCLGNEFAKAPSWPWTFAARLLFFFFSISIIWKGLEMKI